MKKVLSILSTFILASSATLVLTSNINPHNQTNNENKTGINWNGVKNQINTYFNDIKNKNQNKLMLYSTKNNPVNFEEVMKKVQEKSSEYITRFENQNLSFNEITNVLLNENSDFKENYNNILKEQVQKNNSKNSVQNLKILDTTWNEYEKLQTQIPQLRKDATIFTSISVAAAIAATGFYAAAWFFGITLPWAIGCTAISVLAGVGSEYFNITLYHYDQTESYLKNEIQEFNILYDLISYVKNSLLSLRDLLVGEEIAIVASEWAFTPSSVLIPIIFYVLSFVNF